MKRNRIRLDIPLFGDDYFNSLEKKGLTLAFLPFLKNAEEEALLQRTKMHSFMWAIIISTITTTSLDIWYIYLKLNNTIIYAASLVSIIIFFRLLKLYVISCEDYKFFKAEQRKRADQFLITAVYSNIANEELADKIIKTCDLENTRIIPLHPASKEYNNLNKTEASLIKMLKTFVFL